MDLNILCLCLFSLFLLRFLLDIFRSGKSLLIIFITFSLVVAVQMAVAVVSNTLDSKIQSLFLGEDKPSQGHRNATKYVIKYRTNCYPAAAGSVCFRPMSNPKISALD